MTMERTNLKIADACMATQAKLIDCETCYWKVICDLRNRVSNLEEEMDIDIDLTRKAME